MSGMESSPSEGGTEVTPQMSTSLLENSKQAMIAAIEIFNKPAMDYREECAVILVINAWELALKGALSFRGFDFLVDKSKRSGRNAIGFSKVMNAAKSKLGNKFPRVARKNLEILVRIRNSVVHFYLEDDLMKDGVGRLIVAGIGNYFAFVRDFFQQDMSENLNLGAVLIGTHNPEDVFAYIKEKGRTWAGVQSEGYDGVPQICADIHKIMMEIDGGKHESTEFEQFISTQTVAPAGWIDPNKSHPYRMKDALAKLDNRGRQPWSGKHNPRYAFQAVVWHLKMKEDRRYGWSHVTTNSSLYTEACVKRIQDLSEDDIDYAVSQYKKHQAAQRLERAD